MSESIDKKNLRVLMLAEDFYPKTSGGAFKDWNTAVALADAGDSVTVVTPRNKDTPKHQIIDGIEIRRPFRGTPADRHPNSLLGQFRRIIFVLLALPYLAWLCYSSDTAYNIIYSTNHLMNPPAKVLQIVFATPLITFVGYSPTIENARLPNPLVILEEINFRFFIGERAIIESPVVKEAIQSLSDTHVEVVHGTVDEQKIRSVIEEADQNSSNKSDIQLVFVGRLVNIKNPTKPISILEELPSHYALSIIGDGPQRPKVKDACKNSEVSNRVELAGQLPHKQALERIYHADLLLLTSDAEGYPAVAFEALCLGTPVVATEVSVLPSIEHPRLTTGTLEMFPDLIEQSDCKSQITIDETTLNKFSIDRFTSEVRTHMMQVVTQHSEE
jgi:glycosyltransferase involved in cell wall biosynthesis